MTQTAADVLVETLQDWGVEVVFGLPGDGINGILEALRKRQDTIRFVQVRHEEAAAFMACAWAKFTGRLGVCLATSGPGGLHLLNGLYDAKLDGQPVLAITGLQFHDLVSTHTQQDVELDKVFQDVAQYDTRVMGPNHVENVTALACRTAIAYRTVSHVTVPVDVQSEPVRARRANPRNVPHHVSDVRARAPAVPAEEALDRAAALLDAAEKPAILAGRGALGARQALLDVADRLGAPIAKALLGKGVVPDAHPLTTGSIGLLGTRPSQDVMEECDALLMVGTSFPYIEFLPAPGQARAVQIDEDPMRIGLRYPVEVGLVGDARSTLEALLPRLAPHAERKLLDQAQHGMEKWRSLMEERGTRGDVPMKPQVVAWELSRLLDDDAIVSSDSGTIATWWARQIEARADQQFSLSGNLATMANGFPYAIAAQIAHPGRQCVAFVGDGGFSMLLAELATCVKYELPVKVVVIKNDSLGMIKWEQMVFLGNPEYACDLQPIDFVALAQAFGARGFRIDDPSKCGDVLREALAADGPAVVEAVVDPFEPPMPAKIELGQAKRFAESLARGEPNRERIALTVLSDKVRELV